MANHGDMYTYRNVKTRKRNIKPKYNRSQRRLRSQSHVARGEGKKMTSKIQVEPSSEKNLNELKRMRSEENVASGVTVVPEQEPLKKRIRQNYTGSDSKHSLAGSNLECIYKNAHFNSKPQESPPNLVLRPDLSFGSVAPNNTLLTHRRNNIYTDPSIPKEKRKIQDVLTVTCQDGTDKPSLRKVLVMRVREMTAPACTDFSQTIGVENNQIILKDILHSVESDEDVNMHQDLGDIDVIHHTATNNLCNANSSGNFTDLGSYSTKSKQNTSYCRTFSKCTTSQQSFAYGGYFPELSSTSKNEYTMYQSEEYLSQTITVDENQGSDEENVCQGKKESSLHISPLCPQTLSVYSYKNYPTSTQNNMEWRKVVKAKFVASAFFVSICYFITVILPKIMNGM